MPPTHWPWKVPEEEKEEEEEEITHVIPASRTGV